MNRLTRTLKMIARQSLRAVLASPLGTVAEDSCRGMVRRFPYTCRGRGMLIHEVARRKTDRMVADLLCGPKMSVPAIPDGVSLYLMGCLTAEEATTNCFSRAVEPGDCFLDIGANLGFYTLLAGTRVGPAGQVHAFEPQPLLADHLQRSVALNGYGDLVTVNRVAVTDEDGLETQLHLAEDPNSTGIASLYAHEYLGSVGITVGTRTIDAYVGGHPSNGSYVVKVDVEGAELTALRGMSRLLAGGRVKLLVVELSPPSLLSADGERQLRHQEAATPAHIVSYLAGHQYEPREINRDGSLGDRVSIEELSQLQLTTNVAFIRELGAS